jgi:hypothetical protein
MRHETRGDKTCLIILEVRPQKQTKWGKTELNRAFICELLNQVASLSALTISEVCLAAWMTRQASRDLCGPAVIHISDEGAPLTPKGWAC